VSYPPARRVELRTVDISGLTYLELARVAVAAHVPQAGLVEALKAGIAPGATAEIEERAAILLYAIAWQLERRLDRDLTWDDAQTWRVVYSPVDPDDELLVDAEADAEVAAAMLSGAPIVERAGDLTLAQGAAYGRAHDRARKATPRPRRR